ncbi:endoplasmic oxidoreductin-1 [Malassezia nana]|uniref:Endoplasmic oxidoreductin-1 n=1 Tax=Malassezia nana TaxID=180528 RepID=A0AAF0ELI6_9BASI|nr:endoplasmic oxidoreductin-1 [Malassezia nana]
MDYRMNETELPDEFRSYRLSQLEQSAEDHEQGTKVSAESPTEFCQLDDDNPHGDAIFVDLLKNPERFTGYAGPSANRVWRSIYEENCFGGAKWTEPPRPISSGGTGYMSQSQFQHAVKGIPFTLMNPHAGDGGSLEHLIDSVKAPIDPAATEQCLEKRVFYRVISGLHASISIHICKEYLHQDTKTWAPNLECFMTRISQHPERLQNVYFDYVLLMRALFKASEYLEKVGLRDSDRISDKDSHEQLMGLLGAVQSNQALFDEHKLFALNNNPVHNQEMLALKEDFRLHFRNISRIMDCVGCDKCRLWGKVQVTGFGTALKLLFAFEASDEEYVCIFLTTGTTFSCGEMNWSL